MAAARGDAGDPPREPFAPSICICLQSCLHAYAIAGMSSPTRSHPHLIARGAELRELRSMTTAGEPRLPLLAGRRRIGKTVAMLERAASAGRSWAHAALLPEAPLLYVAAGGFEEGFAVVAARRGQPVVALTLEDPFALSGAVNPARA
ncbi:hypothetical protein BH23DEI1_BH23DEI1_11580 [soil metagenome]